MIYVEITGGTVVRYPANPMAAQETAPALVDGVWVQQWQVTDLTPEDLAARLQARRQTMVVSPLQADLALLPKACGGPMSSLIIYSRRLR